MERADDDKDRQFVLSQSDWMLVRAKGRLTFVLGKVGGNRMERATGHGGVFFFLTGTGSD